MNKFIWVNTLEKLIEFEQDFKSKEFGYDTEFTELNWHNQRLIGMSIFDPRTGLDSAFIQFNFWYDYTKKVKEGKGKAIDKVFRYVKTDAIDIEDALPILRRIFNGAKCICASAKVEWKISKKYGYKFTVDLIFPAENAKEIKEQFKEWLNAHGVQFDPQTKSVKVEMK